MEYTAWREDLFGQPSGMDAADVECLQETYQVSADENLEHINHMLIDPEIHTRYSRDQIGTGLQLIFEGLFGPFRQCYIKSSCEQRRLSGIRNISKLYENFFDRYCIEPVEAVGYGGDSAFDYLCYMLWDIFPLYHGELTIDESVAILAVLHDAIEMNNDNCIVSGIHGLGHWAFDEPKAAEVLREWLRNPTTTNPVVLEYAQDAMTGHIQ